RLHNRQQRLQCLPQFIADLLSCHANNNAQPPAFDDLVLLATLSANGRKSAWIQLVDATLNAA
ncbi:hypothetical protein ACI2TB_21565, partial [Ralstonia nicotianae]